jgi:hypothetical protein
MTAAVPNTTSTRIRLSAFCHPLNLKLCFTISLVLTVCVILVHYVAATEYVAPVY